MSAAMLEHLRDLLEPLGRFTARAMFGGYGLYLDGVIIGIVLDEVPYLKTDALTRARFEAAGCAPCVYDMKGRSLEMSYWSVPEAALESPQAMRPWALLALEAAQRKAAMKKPRRR